MKNLFLNRYKEPETIYGRPGFAHALLRAAWSNFTFYIFWRLAQDKTWHLTAAMMYAQFTSEKLMDDNGEGSVKKKKIDVRLDAKGNKPREALKKKTDTRVLWLWAAWITLIPFQNLVLST